MKKCLWIITVILFLGTSAHIWADDTSIYGTVTNPGLEPNILIIFDSSGSMSTQDVPNIPYDPNTTYAGSYSTNAVYYQRFFGGWSEFTSDVENIQCASVKDKLLSDGYARESISFSTLNCPGFMSLRLRLGNYRNYLEDEFVTFGSRIDVAKTVITELVNTTDGVRFGLMRFNNTSDTEADGGRVLAGCGSAKATLIDQIDAIDADGYTPLAETLAEAGLYFAGMRSWFNGNFDYTSPIQERCQKNYIIIMTDGESTKDRDAKLSSGTYINGDTIGDYDNDHGGDENIYTMDGSDYLDDVAKYLYENDCHPTLGQGTAFHKQNIITFTIGFQIQHQLLQDTATNGGGQYYTAFTISELDEAFEQILTAISEENAVFVAPVVPISRMNRTYAGDRIYLGFFKPQQSGRWLGNVKRYALGTDGTLYDANDVAACTPDGLIKDNALSYWTTLGNDGPNVEKGGAAEVLNLLIESTTSRNLYTYTGSVAALTDASNLFADDNTAVTNADLNVSNDTDRQNLIQSVHGSTMGDIIHSEPVVVYYPDPDNDPNTDDAKTMILAGSNDGILHCIDDDDGSEVWGFIPPDLLSRLYLLNDNNHDYFVDGSPVIYDGAAQRILYFVNGSPVFYNTAAQRILFIGERRGGSYYTALDITSYNAPAWLYSIGPHVLDPDPSNGSDVYEELGQSWSKPQSCMIATGSSYTTDSCQLSITTNVVDAFLLAGGYDNNQDNETPIANDSVGRAVFAVNVTDGQLISGLNFNAVNQPTLGMTHSIVDVSGFDHDGDGIVSRIYAGDMGGSIFAFKDDLVQEIDVCGQPVYKSVADGTWVAKRFFNASADNIQRKILYAPDGVEESFGEYIFFGTGDRADPEESDVVNRFYAVKNDWTTTTTLTETNLVDVTADLIQLGTQDEKVAVRNALESESGWYIRLENAGEKVVASPRVYAGVVYFTTYTPDSGSGGDPDDPCAASTVRGVARLYAVDYKTGASVHDFSTDTETDGDTNVVALGKKDRALVLGTAIPSAPVIAILEGGAQIFVGVEGGIVSLPTIPTEDMHRYYWHQLF
ncbi:MAG: VWA domain-containing protein [Desulfobacterales bacterium]|nr:MAG: VWA domain-containing protein [Desulfobacterales bacterium]